MAGYLRRLSPYRRVGGYISGGTASQPGSYPTTTSAVWSLDDLYLRRVGPLLDNYPNAAAAYSLRSLTSAYTGPVVTVRRSTDSAEADFTASEVSDGTLAGWTGADGFVKTWWDQSGNARHATQATATAQPQIVDSGVLVTESGKPALRFNGVDDYLAASPVGAFGYLSVFTATRPIENSATEDAVYLQVNESGGGILVPHVALGARDGGFFVRYNDGSTSHTLNGFDVSTTSQSILSTIVNATAVSNEFFFNGAEQSDANDGRSGVADYGITIGTRSDAALFFANIAMQELLIYPTDQTANRVGIEDNINLHYSVF